MGCLDGGKPLRSITGVQTLNDSGYLGALFADRLCAVCTQFERHQGAIPDIQAAVTDDRGC